jgi:hypothetical protein
MFYTIVADSARGKGSYLGLGQVTTLPPPPPPTSLFNNKNQQKKKYVP